MSAGHVRAGAVAGRLFARAALPAFAVLAALAGGCGRESPAPGSTVPARSSDAAPAATQAAWREGHYRATLTTPGGELPFGLELARDAAGPVAFLVNGAERVEVRDVRIDGSRLTLGMPGYRHSIVAESTAEGLAGEALLVRRRGEIARLPFAATRGATHRFSAEPAAPAGDLGGSWSVTFVAADGRRDEGVAEFEQQGSRVTGTFVLPTGDHRFIEGELRGRELHLSRFDGGSAFLYRATLAADGTLEGRFWSGNWSEQPWTARRAANARLAVTGAAEVLRNPGARFAFEFPDLEGRPVSLSDPRFRDRVVIVTIGGSWCPNCHDEAAFLQPRYRALRERGLEIVALQFEYFEDFAEAVASNRRFVARHGIEWPVLIAGFSDQDDVLEKLPQLRAMKAYPTAFFLDRAHRVRHVHVGFAGPATGRHYEEWAREFDEIVARLLAEPAPSAGTRSGHRATTDQGAG